MTDHLARLIKLEDHLWPKGCATCTHWGPAAHVFAGQAVRPECCPVCGRRVPICLVRTYRVEHDIFGEERA